MFTSYVQNSTQSASDKNASKTWSPALKEHKIDVVEALQSVCSACFLRAALLHRVGLHRQTQRCDSIPLDTVN